MTIVVAPDKFKESLTAVQVCEAIKEGLSLVNPAIRVITIPLADGGEGTGDLLTALYDGISVSVKVRDPLFREIDCSYGISKDGTIAYIEMAKASGLQLLKREERNPLKTTSYGTGQLILDALNRGANQIILGLGGSATNDAGIGMAAALGFEFYSANGDKLIPVGENLAQIASIVYSNTHSLLMKTRFTVLCDVENALCGKQGAAYVFGPQKGADEAAVKALDLGLGQFMKVAEKTFHVNPSFPGAGAAGGLGGGAKVFLKAQLEKGFDFIARHTKLEEEISKADYVITGEGRMDTQTLSGKVVKGVAKLAARYHLPCIAMTGSNLLDTVQLEGLALSAMLSLADENTSEKEAMANAYVLLKDRTRNYFKQTLSS